MSEAAKKRVAVVLFNLGGPDRPDAIRPFLFNLFNDPAIIQLPGMIRTPLASLISSRREKQARETYGRLGGASPLMAETEAQAQALQAALAKATPDTEVKVFIAMRYWTPMTAEAVRAVEDFAPDDVVLLPLYPQFSTTTTGSSLRAWREAWRAPISLRTVCCYPTEPGFVEAHATRIADAWLRAGAPRPVRLLFSAHGLPEKVIKQGDPYQDQVDATAAAVAEKLGGDWDWRVCYQSRVGPMKWIGPSTPEAIADAAREGLGVVVCPIAFVSEHVETLVELDHDYAVLARDLGCPSYIRVPALGTDEAFIAGLARLVGASLASPKLEITGEGDWRPQGCRRCSDRGRRAA